MINHQTIQQLDTEYQHSYPNPPVSSKEQSISDRIRRSISWLRRSANLAEEDKPPRLIDLWIALNALYGVVTYNDQEFNMSQKKSKGELFYFKEFLGRLVRLDKRQTLRQLIDNRIFRNHSLDIIRNPYLWNDFWRNDQKLYEKKSREELDKARKYLDQNAIKPFFACLFKRLSTLRNQIIHGSSSATTNRNQDALVPALTVMEAMLPVFIKIMTPKGATVAWPEVPYPGKGTPQHPVQSKNSSDLLFIPTPGSTDSV